MNRRYVRHFDLFGKSGQYAILEAKVLVIGAGGLGCFVLYNLAAAGVGQISIVDFDRVSASNLNRQILYDNCHISFLKAKIAKKKIELFNPDCKVLAHTCKIEENQKLIKDHEIIVDCSDNFKTRFFINKNCHKLKKILISGSVARYQGYVLAISSFFHDQPCYNCFCPSNYLSQINDNSCEGVGVLGSVVATVAGIQSTNVIRAILQENAQDFGHLFKIDCKQNSFAKLRILKDPKCAVCSV